MKTALQALLVLACIGLLAANVFLQQHSNKLAAIIENLQATEGPPIGSSFKWLAGFDIEGNPVNIDYSQKNGRSLLLLFSPACAYTDQNAAYWRELLREVPDADVVLGDVSGEADMKYLSTRGFSSAARIVRITPEMRWTYDLRVTPMTLVIDAGGRVEGAWVGVLNERKVEQIVSMLLANEHK